MPENRSGIALGDSLVIQYDDALDPLLVPQWKSSNINLTFQVSSTTKDNIWEGISRNYSLPGHQTLWYTTLGRLITVYL